MAKKVKCILCPKECELREGERGDCKVRINLDGKLQTLVYGNPCAVHNDPIEKKPLYHFLPGTSIFSIATAGCNLHCKCCQNWEISQFEPEETNNYDLLPQMVVDFARKYRSKSIAYTYSEPVIFYEYTLDTSKIARQYGLKNVLVTAGYINEKPLREILQFIDASNVDLKGFDETFYKDHTTGDLKTILRCLEIHMEMNVWLEITNLVIPTLNDNEKMIKDMCRWIVRNLGKDVPIHFTRFHPDYKLINLPPTPVKTLEMARDIAFSEGVHFAFAGNVPGHPGNNTFCYSCGELLIERYGFSISELKLKDSSCPECGAFIKGVWQ